MSCWKHVFISVVSDSVDLSVVTVVKWRQSSFSFVTFKHT